MRGCRLNLPFPGTEQRAPCSLESRLRAGSWAFGNFAPPHVYAARLLSTEDLDNVDIHLEGNAGHSAMP